MASKLLTRYPTSLYMPMRFSMVAKTAKTKIAEWRDAPAAELAHLSITTEHSFSVTLKL
jgi:hypothetical protein